MECAKCLSSIDARSESFVVCEGECSKSYHIHCVGLLESNMESLAVKNILWMCDCCLAYFCRKRSAIETPLTNSSANLASELAEIKSQIHDIVNTLSSITSKSLPDEAVKSSTPPFSSTQLSNGSRTSCTTDPSFETSDCVLESCSSSKRNFSLFLTNISSSVTEREIDCMVRRSVGIEKDEEVDILKLVPRWKKESLLDYASFKVVLNMKWKTVVMNPDTWPSGIKFREFLNLGRNTWSPEMRN